MATSAIFSKKKKRMKEEEEEERNMSLITSCSILSVSE
jgi:hypothetical protein